MGANAPLHFHVALLGFSRFERQTLAAYLKRSEEHSPAYELVDDIVDADMLVADADHLGALDQVQALARTRDAVFVGSSAPEGALGWMMRPLDPMQVLRVPRAALAGWLEPQAGQPLEAHLYIVDPLGQWMMRAPPQADPSKLKRDIDRLLRGSAGWDRPGR